MANQPKILYHGSPIPNIAVFEPRISHGSGEQDGANVYATNDLVRAICHCIQVNGPWSTSHINGVWYAIFPKTKQEVENSPAGYLYYLPPQSFKQVSSEFRSSLPVVPTKCEKIEHPLQEAIKLGVIPVFLTAEEYDTYLKTKVAGSDERLKFIQSKLQP